MIGLIPFVVIKLGLLRLLQVSSTTFGQFNSFIIGAGLAVTFFGVFMIRSLGNPLSGLITGFGASITLLGIF